MTVKCHRVWDADFRLWCHIPGCEAAAHLGPSACTCDYSKKRERRTNHDLRRELAQAKQLIRALRKANSWNLNLLISKDRNRQPICNCLAEAPFRRE